ncbi:MAG: hypothetical protein RR590_09785, partial [Hungatella sp.]
MMNMEIGRTRRKRHSPVKEYKRIVAFMLTLIMIFTNIGGNVTVSFAADVDHTLAIFALDGVHMKEAAKEAIHSGEVFDMEMLELISGSASLANSYEKLLGNSDQAVYEFFAEPEGINLPDGAELRTFIRVAKDAAEDYTLTGKEDIVFLFINGGESRCTFRANVDGYQTSK